MPFSDTDFRERFQWHGFDAYLAYEQLYEIGLIDEDQLLPLEQYYDLLEDEETIDVLNTLGLPTKNITPKGILKISNTPATNPEFQLTLRNENGEVLKQIANVQMPFVFINSEKFVLPKDVWLLHEAILSSDFSTGYEKTAKVSEYARKANIELDDFLTRENYHYIDKYEVVPELHNSDLMELKIVGEDEIITEHLNSSGGVSSIRKGMTRERYQSSPEVKADLELIHKKKYLRGHEIPQFFENPYSLFPEHNFVFDLEKFSDRVTGFIEIKKPRMMQKEGKWGWFDNETGESLDVDEDELKTVISKNPDKNFVPYKNSWIYVDKALRKQLGLVDDSGSEKQPKLVLDILDNEEKLDYIEAGNEKRKFKEYDIPTQLKADLFDHQKEGYSWICSLEENGVGGLLADDMGLGKTIQVITFLLRQRQRNSLKPSLIVLPIALIENWVNEISKFAPELKNSIYVHQGGGRIKNVSKLENFELIFTSYDTLKIDQLLFGQIHFKNIIADEAQNVKSHSSQRSRAIRAMKGDFRLAMTGTPVENSLEELWTIMDFVQPGAMSALSEFRRKYIKSENYDELMELLKPYYLRRTKDEVLKDKLPAKHLLPPKYVQASTVQQQLAHSMMVNVKSGKANVLNVLTNLRQMYAHPGIFEHVNEHLSINDAPKLKEVLSLLEDIKKKNEKVLIFTEFRKIHAILKREIALKFGISVPVIDGDTKNRPEVVDRFNKTAGFAVILLSPKAAGVGLTITSANHVIHYTRWWNPAVENQATDRAYRIGQQKEVFVYQIITQDPRNFPRGTVEEIMHEMLSVKSDLANNVIIPFDTSTLQQQVAEAFSKQN
ncbi:DEAD/DEAH box helicase [Chungangia koreensis]|uniref:DEAD/DEAH box helicase n=1 Tax=Chungangia koreensis TaxID=752657 RepID=A0ABV8WZB9_9LACT